MLHTFLTTGNKTNHFFTLHGLRFLFWFGPEADTKVIVAYILHLILYEHYYINISPSKPLGAGKGDVFSVFKTVNPKKKGTLTQEINLLGCSSKIIKSLQ